VKLTLFDLDHTLLDGDTDVLWCEFLLAEGVLDRNTFEPRNADMAARYKTGAVSTEEFCNFYVGTLTGQSPAYWEPLRQRFFRSHIVPRLPTKAVTLVNQHLDAGELVVLTTATNRYLTELTAIYLGFEHVIATEPELEQGRFTGRCTGTLNMREGKVARLHTWLQGTGKTLAQFDSTAYSDSINDLPLLLAVHHAVAVNPDAQLRQEAATRGWPILRLHPG
jgi:HAD superfamily hydrolase (TIGR01490 family)